MTQVPAAATRQARGQSSIYTLPRDWDSLDQVLVPLVERIDPMNAAPQLLVVTPDVESAVALVAGAFARMGPQGVDILPATSAARAARLLKSDPMRAVAAPPWVLRQLLTASALPLGSVKAVLFAWLDDVIEEGGEAMSDLEAVLAEIPREAVRTLVVRGITPAAERFTDRHMHHARRVASAGSAVESRLPVSYVTTVRAARPAALRLVLDELDPPSAMVLARDDLSEEEARGALHQLGYRRIDDVVRVSRGEVPPNTHTVIFYDVPLNAAPLDLVAESKPARVVVLVEPRELGALRRLTGGRASPLERREGVPRARRADELLQQEIRQVLDAGFGGREISSIEPLLAEYDAVEIAGALVRLLETERERAARLRSQTASAAGGDRRERTGPRTSSRDARPQRGHRSDRPPGAERKAGTGRERRGGSDRGFDRGGPDRGRGQRR